MMVPKKSLILAGAALTLFGASASAQSQSSKVFARCNKPLKSVSLDLATGTITKGPAVNDRAGSTIVDFANNDLGGFVGVDTGSGACAWIDSASKGFAGNGSDLMDRVVFAYCSSAQGVPSGGPGGAATLGFYEGYTVGGGAASTNVGTFGLTGLPANTASSSFFGGFTCYFIQLTFANLVPFADGAIGYSWQFDDVGTTGTLAATFPFLSCVQSCTGPGVDAQGMTDLVDQYCPPGSLLSTFSFGTYPTGGYFTSISMDVRESTDSESVATSWNSEAINVDTLTSNAITVGGTWTTGVTINHPHGASGALAMKVRGSCYNGPNATSPVGGRPVELLTQGGIALALSGSHNGSSGSFPAFAVPAVQAYCGLGWACQATILGGGFADLSSARCGTVGNIDLVPDP
jgi:hypothetical protein